MALEVRVAERVADKLDDRLARQSWQTPHLRSMPIQETETGAAGSLDADIYS